MKKMVCIAMMIGAVAAPAASAHGDPFTAAHKVVHIAITHDPHVCPKIELAVFLHGYRKAERAFVREWNQGGYGARVSGAAVFEELVAQCGRQTR